MSLVSDRSRLSAGRQKIPSVQMSPVWTASSRSFWIENVDPSSDWARYRNHGVLAGSLHGLPTGNGTPCSGPGTHDGRVASLPLKVAMLARVDGTFLAGEPR